jgi:hypothetical protein
MDPHSPLIQLEIQEIEANISTSGADKRWWDFRAIFNSAGNRYRFGLCAIVSIWGQLSGNGLITYFLPVLLLQAGITDSNRQRVLNFVNSITSFVGALSGTAIVDKVGRRKLFLTAEICCVCGMAIVAGLLSDAGPQNAMRANAGISFIFLFMVLFSFGITPLQALYPAEVLAFENRAKGLALQGWVTNAVSLINTFGLPSALAALTWKTYLIFMVWDIVGVITIYWLVVETKQLCKYTTALFLVEIHNSHEKPSRMWTRSSWRLTPRSGRSSSPSSLGRGPSVIRSSALRLASVTSSDSCSRTKKARQTSLF